MIKYFRVTDMTFTPFENGSSESLGRAVLQKEGIVPTDNPWECQLLVTNRYPERRSFPMILKRSKLSALAKPLLLWTHEPRYCTLSAKVVDRKKWLLSSHFHVMNMYTEDLYLSNYSFYSWAIQKPKVNINDIKESESLRKHRIAALMKYIHEPSVSRSLIKDNENIDLCALRQKIAISGYKRNFLDIYGRHWPKGISKEATRGPGWHSRKIEILESYRFNLCLENTNFNYYCTEKIWDAIRAGCLPIYYGKNNRIYDDFPQNSFVDVAEYAGIPQLLDHVETMSLDEYYERLAKCIGVYNKFLETNSFETEYTAAIISTAHRIKSILNQSKDSFLRFAIPFSGTPA